MPLPAFHPNGRSNGANRWRGIVPVAGWVRGYSWKFLRADLLAGLTLAAYLLPGGLGDATLAGLPPQAGLYACMWAGLVFWLFCAGRHTAVSVTSSISLLIGSSLAGLAGGDPARFSILAACTALLVGAIAFLAWLARAGVIANFVSESVMVGFKAGVALHLASTQLPKLFGLPSAHGDFFQRIASFFGQLDRTNGVALAFGGAALALLVTGKCLWRHKPVALVVVVAAIAISHWVGPGRHGVAMLGEVPHGLPPVAWPMVSVEDWRTVLPLALACFLLGSVETAAIGRLFAEKHGYRADTNQDFLALAGANLAAGLGGGYPVSGGVSQSLVNEGAGARTPFSGLVAALLVLMVAVFASAALRDLPQPVLAAVVLVAVSGLVEGKRLVRLWRFHRGEFVVAVVALLGVLGAGLLNGVLLGATISLVLLLVRVSKPHVAFLGRIPGARRFSDLARHGDNLPIPGVLAFRVESALVYFNVEHVLETVLARIDDPDTGPIHLVVCDLSTSPMVDVAGARLFLKLDDELDRRGIALRVVEAHSSVRDMLRVEGVEEKVGRIDRFTSLADAIDGPRADDPRPVAFPPKTEG